MTGGSQPLPLVMVAPIDGEQFPMIRLTSRYDERYSNFYLRIDQAENLHLLSDKKTTSICIKVYRLLNGCREEVGQTETSSEVNPTFANSKQMSMEVKMEEVKATRLVIVVNTLGVFGRDSDEVGLLQLSIEHLLSAGKVKEERRHSDKREAAATVVGEGRETTQSFLLLRCDRSSHSHPGETSLVPGETAKLRRKLVAQEDDFWSEQRRRMNKQEAVECTLVKRDELEDELSQLERQASHLSLQLMSAETGRVTDIPNIAGQAEEELDRRKSILAENKSRLRDLTARVLDLESQMLSLSRSGVLKVGLKWEREDQLLTISVISARNLPSLNQTDNFSDPYVKVTLMRKGAEKPEVVGKTETIWRTLEPIWAEGTMTIQVEEALEEVSLGFVVKDDSKVSWVRANETIGKAFINRRSALGLEHLTRASRQAGSLVPMEHCLHL